MDRLDELCDGGEVVLQLGSEGGKVIVARRCGARDERCHWAGSDNVRWLDGLGITLCSR